MGTKLLFHDKRITIEGYIIEIKIWQVPSNKDFQEGIKYSLFFIHNEKRIFGYDNERGKGHHEHRYDNEKKFKFTTWEELLTKFQSEVNKIKGELYGNENKKY